MGLRAAIKLVWPNVQLDNLSNGMQGKEDMGGNCTDIFFRILFRLNREISVMAQSLTPHDRIVSR